jgi:hypothetical protein
MNEAIENAISAACADGFQPVNFTQEQKDYISANQAALGWLLQWFESNSSDGCWTTENYQFMRGFYHAAA